MQNHTHVTDELHGVAISTAFVGGACGLVKHNFFDKKRTQDPRGRAAPPRAPNHTAIPPSLNRTAIFATCLPPKKRTAHTRAPYHTTPRTKPHAVGDELAQPRLHCTPRQRLPHRRGVGRRRLGELRRGADAGQQGKAGPRQKEHLI